MQYCFDLNVKLAYANHSTEGLVKQCDLFMTDDTVVIWRVLY